MGGRDGEGEEAVTFLRGQIEISIYVGLIRYNK